MPDWLTSSFSSGKIYSLRDIIVHTLVAVACGMFVALIYRLSHGRHKKDPFQLQATLMIMTILIALVSMVIGDSVALAFSLVGALSIVRFRTVVDDTRDTAFVIFAVIVGMACGIGQIFIPMVGIPIVGVVAIALSRNGGSKTSRPTKAVTPPQSKLLVRLGLGHEPAVLEDCFSRHFKSHQIISVETARQGAAIDLNYRGELINRAAMAEFVTELNRIEGVQSVELRG